MSAILGRVTNSTRRVGSVDDQSVSGNRLGTCMSEAAPAFSFYAKDFILGTSTMSLAARGAYITLLAYQWDHGSVPADHNEVARLCGCSIRQLEAVWTTVIAKFHRGTDGLFRNARLERERLKQAERRAVLAANGKKGGRPGNQTETKRLRLGKPNGNQKQSLPSPFPLPSSSSVSDPVPSEPSPASGGDVRFEQFWAVYPNHKGKDDARKAWQRRRPSEALTDIIIAAVKAQCLWPEWIERDGKFIPHPATWLNRGCWDDEPRARRVTASVGSAWACPHVVPCGSPGACQNATVLGRPTKETHAS
jgi:uncharacterized protein YdaU (DUF1376 family)